MQEVKIEESWKKRLEDEFGQEYFTALSQFVREEYQKGTVYPHPKHVFRCFDECPFDSVKVVVLGQDPYHGHDKGIAQANGLCFAVNPEVRPPPSLQNIFRELESDLGHAVDKSPDLSRWARQGVLLLNATLTVSASKPGSHQGRGWEQFTDAVIRKLNDEREHIVFILWGNYAKQKGAFIDRSKHFVIESPHPSPFSAHSGFFGSKPFSKTNAYLTEHSITPIEW